MTDSQSTILKMLSKALFGCSVSIDAVDWLEVLKEAKNQAVVQLIYSVLDKSALSPDEAKAWKQAASADFAKNIRIGHNHSLLHQWMNDIPYVILNAKACCITEAIEVAERGALDRRNNKVVCIDVFRVSEPLVRGVDEAGGAGISMDKVL